MSKYIFLRRQVADRGRPPESFLDELIAWAKQAPDEIFAANAVHDIYAQVREELSPWRGIGHRRAVMVECLRVLAGFESSWNWNDGRDVTNPNRDTSRNEETGIFQVSADSMDLDKRLRALVRERLGSDSPTEFIWAMKHDHAFALEYAARLLRVTVNHNGPVKRKEINPCLSRAAVREAERLIGPEEMA